MSDESVPIVKSRCVEFREGSISIYGDGTARFHFRGMGYTYKPGSDSLDGWEIRVSKETAAAIKSLFEREYWP